MSLTRNLAARHGRDGIRVNALVLGSIVTPAWSDRAAARPQLFDELVPLLPALDGSAPPTTSRTPRCSSRPMRRRGSPAPRCAVDGGHLVWNGDLAQVAEPRACRRDPDE